MNKTILTLIIGCVFFTACRKESFVEIATKTTCLHQTENPTSRNYACNELVVVNYATSHCGFMPLNSRNYWVYEDSFFANGAFLRVQFDTLRFNTTYRSTSDNLIWWERNNVEIGLPSIIFTNETGLFQLGRRLFTECTWEANKEFISPDGESSVYLTRFEDIAAQGKAVKLTDIVYTPAGNFEDCILFEKYSRNYRKDQVIFKPGIGVVKYTSEKSQLGQPVLKPYQVSTLVGMHLE